MQTIFGSHSAIAPFRLERPRAAADAAALLAAAGPAGALLAGGVDLVPALRAARPVATIVSLDRIAELREVARTGATLRIGAGVTYARLAEDAIIREALPDLTAIWNGVANVRIRTAATLGGNIMSGNPAYDALPALMAMGARLVFALANGKRRTFDPNIEDARQGVLVAAEVPIPRTRRFVFERGHKPVISVAVSIERNDTSLQGRVAFGCAHARPIGLGLALAGAADLAGIAGQADMIAADAARRLPEPVSDANAGAAYRRHLAPILLARALRGLGTAR